MLITNQMRNRGVTVWFTGLSGAGKTAVALEIEKRLKKNGIRVERLDGDIVRQYLSGDLGYSKEDRDKNIRRVSYVASLLTRNGIITLCSFISPYRKSREEARELINDFIEVYVNAPLSVCEKRDSKGLYAKARRGEIAEFTGISDPYEAPENPELELRTDCEGVEECADRVIKYLKKAGYILPKEADLHLHTSASDGIFQPMEVIKKAKEAGFDAVAITDHDSLEGIEESLKAGESLSIEVIPGIELSTLHGKSEIHILGYFIDIHDQNLNSFLAEVVEARKARASRIVEKLLNLGLDISMARVREIAGNSFIGRLHIAQAMLEKGYINKLEEAFSGNYLGRGGKAYVERYKITPHKAIQLLKNAGGLAVLAHPGYLSDRSSLSEEVICNYVKHGLDGLEVYYSRHTLQQVHYYAGIARKHKLLITGGSDCHGHKEPLIGSVRLDYRHVEALKDAKKRKR